MARLTVRALVVPGAVGQKAAPCTLKIDDAGLVNYSEVGSLKLRVKVLLFLGLPIDKER